MKEGKYSKFLTVLLIIVIIGIVILLGFLGYDIYNKYYIEKSSEEFVEQFGEKINQDNNEENKNNKENEDNEDNNEVNEIIVGTIPEGSSNNNTSSEGRQEETQVPQREQYQGFYVSGTIEIPKINLKYPILESISTKGLDTAVCFEYGAGINQVGNSVIAGHNYRNGLFFANNKKLEIGDKIYITDLNKVKLEYVIFDKFETDDNDMSFYGPSVEEGKTEVALRTCTDDSKARLVLRARAVE